jgi:hypothetical protein
MVEVGVVIKWSTGTLAGRHSVPYIDVPSYTEEDILQELTEIIPGKYKEDWAIVESEVISENSFASPAQFTQEYISDRAYRRQKWQINKGEQFS